MPRITFDFGINETEATQETEALTGENFDLELAARRLFPRKPIDLKGTLPNAGSVNGIMQLITREDVETTLVYSGEATTPAVYSWTGDNTSTAFTSERTTNCFSASMLRDTYWALDDYLLITDLRKLTPLLNWDGTSCTRQKTNLGSGTTTVITDITESPAGTYTVTSVAHGLAIGDTAIVAASGNSDLDGEHEVTAVPGANTWVFEDTAGYGDASTGTTEPTVDLYAKYSIVHNNRMWLFNITTISGGVTSEIPHMILASTFEDAASYDTVNRNGIATGNAAFFTLTPDLKEINGAALINRQLVISTHDGVLHKLSGLDASDYQFTSYYAGSSSVSEESMTNIGNDITYMLNGGGVELFSATDTSGDVAADDISRWIPTTTKDLTFAVTIYDQQNQKILYFVDGKILVLFKDILATGGGSPWTFYTTTLTNPVDSSSIFNTKGAKYMRRPGLTTRSVYFGDISGNIYDINGSGSGDNGTTIHSSRKTKLLEMDRGNIVIGHIQYRRIGEFSCSLVFDWSNEYNTTISDIGLQGPPITGGDTVAYWNLDSYWEDPLTSNNRTDYYNEGFAFAGTVSKQNFAPAGRADGYFLTVEQDTTVQYQIDHIQVP